MKKSFLVVVALLLMSNFVVADHGSINPDHGLTTDHGYTMDHGFTMDHGLVDHG